MAKRTFEESGHYYVKEFITSVKDSINDQIGNRGVYLPGQVTASGQNPSDDLGVYKISPGTAYVSGYRVQILGTTLVDFNKPRTTKNLENQSISFGFRPSFNVNNVTGNPEFGIDTTYEAFLLETGELVLILLLVLELKSEEQEFMTSILRVVLTMLRTFCPISGTCLFGILRFTLS